MIDDPGRPITPPIDAVSTALFMQIMSVMGLKRPNWVTRLLYPFFLLPIRRMARIAVDLDRDIAQYGWYAAVNRLLTHFVIRLDLHGAQNIPAQGSLIVISNHPAALDVAILAAAVKRDDLKILASDIPIVQMLPNVRQHSIPVYYNIPMRLATVRDAIRHLSQAGSLLIFPRGNVEPDPAISPGAMESMNGWSPSIELLLRRVPETLVVVSIASGMLSAGWYKNPLTNLWKKYEQRQKVAEVFQIAAQLVTGRTPHATPTVSFLSPLSIDDLGGENVPDGLLMAKLVAEARSLLESSPSLIP
jgi:hypothetical protein